MGVPLEVTLFGFPERPTSLSQTQAELTDASSLCSIGAMSLSPISIPVGTDFRTLALWGNAMLGDLLQITT